MMSETPDASPEALESIGWGAIPVDDRVQVARIAAELERGFHTLRDIEPAVALFGSARSAESASEYQAAREISRAVARMGFNVLTGGGPGVMEAASRGCREGGGLSVGLTIRLQREQRTNRFVERECSFQYFFVRKLMFMKYSCAFLIFPGGFGTLDETFEALTLVQTHKIPHFPVLVFGGGFWAGLNRQLEMMEGQGLISAEDRARLVPVSTAEETTEVLRCCHEGLCATLRKPPLRARPPTDGTGANHDRRDP